MILAILILSEYPSNNQYLGGVLIVAGIWGVLYARALERRSSVPRPVTLPMSVIIPVSSAPGGPTPPVSPIVAEIGRKKEEFDDGRALTRGDFIVHYDYNDPLSSLVADLAVKDPKPGQ